MTDLAQMAHQLRVDVLKMVHRAGTGHMGGSYSIAELLTVLYFDVMRVDPQNPKWEDRDRLVLSKGHAAPILYAALARRGYFALEALDTLRQRGSILQGHPDMKRTPGVDLTSGCLGEGLSNGCGFACSARLSGRDNHVFVILGDGELQEGQIWEAALFAADKKLNNLTAIMDEPTRGIDVGAKREIFLLIQELAKKGVAIVLISSEMPEILGMSDRILVMHEGSVKGELSRAEATEKTIMHLMLNDQPA